MKNKYLLPLLSVFFLMIIMIYLANLYHCAKLYHGYVVADWLINFSSGFVRRGLSGFLILHLSDFSGIQANFMVDFVQVFFYLSYMITLYVLIRKKRIDLWFLILLLSPVTLLFPIIDVAAVGRKEIILFTLFGFYLLFLKKGWLRSYAVATLFAIVFFIATFFHELMFFYTPYFFLAMYIQSANPSSVPRRFTPLIIASGSLLAIIFLWLFGKSIDGPCICADLTRRGLAQDICSGILAGKTEYSIRYILEQGRMMDYYVTYPICILLGLVPLVFFIYNAKSHIVNVKKFFSVFCFLFLFSAPLFCLAFDWGRWINIHFVLLLFTCTFLLKDKTAADPWNNERLRIPSIWSPQTKLSKVLNNTVFLGFCLCYLSFWQMRHFNQFSVFYLEKYEGLEYEIDKTINIANELFIQPFEFL